MARVRDGKIIYESTEGNPRKRKRRQQIEKEDPPEEEETAEEEEEEEEEEGEEAAEEDEEEEEAAGEDEEEEEAAGEDEEEEEAAEEEAPPRHDSEEDDGESSDQGADDDNEGAPLVVEKMFFEPEEYIKVCKIATRCRVKETVEYIEGFKTEVKWFQNHSQFKHVFHMYKEPNHMIQGFWMLLLRTANTCLSKECWFVVNGVPIRYSLKEHALLTGFSCHEYPDSYRKNLKEKTWDLRFVKRIFKRERRIKLKDVEDQLMKMKKKSLDRKKMMILYFLCRIVKANSKSNGNIDGFLLSIIDDLKACEEFPWGRYTFEACLNGIKRSMRKMKGKVKPKAQIGFTGFIVPLEIMAFECIPRLGQSFRVDVPANEDCPRMCKRRFSDNCNMKGIPLEDINEKLGRTKDITSLLKPNSAEKTLLARILGDEEDNIDSGIGHLEPIVDSWRDHLVKGKKVWFKSMYDLDVGVRTTSVSEDVGCSVTENVVHANSRGLKEVMEEGFERFKKEIFEKLDVIDARLTTLEVIVAGEAREAREAREGEEAGETEVGEAARAGAGAGEVGEKGEGEAEEAREGEEAGEAEAGEAEEAEEAGEGEEEEAGEGGEVAEREGGEVAEGEGEQVAEREEAAGELGETGAGEVGEVAEGEGEQAAEREEAAGELGEAGAGEVGEAAGEATGEEEEAAGEKGEGARGEEEEKEKKKAEKKKKGKKHDETVTLIPTGEKRTRHRPKVLSSPWKNRGRAKKQKTER